MDYIQHTDSDIKKMLDKIGISSIEELFESVPEKIRFNGKLSLPNAHSELELRKKLEELAAKNISAGTKNVCFLGGGCYDHAVPAVVDTITSRGEFYTAYTPYQPEASQGTLQSIFEYQTVICELTGMEVSNASHYDGGTAFAEALIMAYNLNPKRNKILVSKTTHPEYRQIAKTYTAPFPVEIIDVDFQDGKTDLEKLKSLAKKDETLCIAFQTPNFFGCIEECFEISKIARSVDALLVTAVDPISLAILAPPGAYDADIAVGEGQPLGCEMYFGGPHFGFFTTKSKYIRKIPGRLISETVDTNGKRAFVMTLMTREQHIRREKATSNICTNQALMAMRGLIYLVALGKKGLKETAELCTQKAHYAYEVLSKQKGFAPRFNAPFMREFALKCPKPAAQIIEQLTKSGFSVGPDLGKWYPELKDTLLIALTEKRTKEEIDSLVAVLAKV
ncbi:MAG: aminomethyl-transferring glycine dehydrogenase subunit GcvPA [Planctomycetota bacterium]